MLRKLVIQNYLLIDHVEIDLREGFTILTGETGSGKSMLVDAIQLALGHRADPGSLRDPQKRCIVELELDASHLQDWFLSNDIPFELIACVRRQIDVGGRSRAFVNDTPVRLEQLKELADRVVHVHSQHQTRLLNDSATLVRMLDRSAGLSALVQKYRKSFSRWKALRKELKELKENALAPSLDADYLRFQLDELQAAQLEGAEMDKLEKELNTAEKAEDLIRLCGEINDSLDGELAILSTLHDLYGKAAKLAEGSETMRQIAERLNSVYLELKDLNREADDHGQGLVVDEERAQWLKDRIDTIHRLIQKHRVQDEAALLSLCAEIELKLNMAESADQRLVQLEQDIAVELEKLMVEGRELSSHRLQAVPMLEKNITERLQLLGMPKARFRLELKGREPNDLGVDEVLALFTADPDRPLGPLSKIASGGELSRVMLAMISPTAKAMGVGTIIFDEIDTGVSGEVAGKVGTIIKSMSSGAQIIAISHLPQVASKADQHLYVVKEPSSNGTASVCRELDKEERVQAIAEMLSGSSTSDAALENARELLTEVSDLNY